MGTDRINIKLSRVYLTPSRAEQFARPYAEKMRARGYEVRVRTNDIWGPAACVVDVFCKR